ncbi:hypothetical protein F4777DRAFT_290192 [Nemania sp. FL0916]|nr:hypothetical protein F4777DRAFT_290192 [Nemania sp. FL0916]
MVHPLPMVTPGMMVVLPPIQQSSPMVTGRANSMPSRRGCTSVSCVAAKMDTNGPNCTRFPIVTMPQSRITRLENVEVGIEIISDLDIASVIDINRRLDERAGADPAHYPLQQGLSVLDQGLGRSVVREVCVVLVHEPPRFEAAFYQSRLLCVVPSFLVRVFS